jgi:hypothetical protein
LTTPPLTNAAENKSPDFLLELTRPFSTVGKYRMKQSFSPRTVGSQDLIGFLTLETLVLGKKTSLIVANQFLETDLEKLKAAAMHEESLLRMPGRCRVIEKIGMIRAPCSTALLGAIDVGEAVKPSFSRAHRRILS